MTAVGTGRVWRGSPPVAAAVHRDRKVESQSVACPVCGASVGEQCVTASGKHTVHPPRRVMALRAETETYSGADVEYARQRGLRERTVARQVAGFSRDQLATAVGVGYWVVAEWETDRRVPSGPRGAAYGAFLRLHLEGVAAHG